MSKSTTGMQANQPKHTKNFVYKEFPLLKKLTFDAQPHSQNSDPTKSDFLFTLNFSHIIPSGKDDFVSVFLSVDNAILNVENDMNCRQSLVFNFDNQLD